MIDLELPLDTNNPEAPQFLNGIQGNIIKGHGRDHTAHLILKMTGDRQAVKSWIAKFAREHVTSAAIARRQTSAWQTVKDKGEPFAMLLLAPDGYRYLGFGDDQLPGPRGQFTDPVHRQYFLLGMKGQSTIPAPGRPYNDPPPAQWEPAYQQQIHAMVLLADDDLYRLDQSVRNVAASLAGVFELLATERGHVLKDKFPQRGELTIEHFGFQDGVSQPLMIQQDIDREIAQRGSVHWTPAAPLGLALVEEPGGGTFGSFMVYRKLEQNVKAFWDTLGQLAKQSGLGIEALGAMAVGRSRDGTPVVPTTTIDPKADPNDFHFDQDPDGAKCPFHAHIRKTNPRGDIPRIIGAPAEFERARRIVRRGITYGDRPDVSVRPETGVGLLFMCFQSNLDQFAIQQEGTDSNDFVNPSTGVDAVIGQNSAAIAQTWPSGGTVKFTMANMVKMQGGEYFFAPSMAFLKGLS